MAGSLGSTSPTVGSGADADRGSDAEGGAGGGAMNEASVRCWTFTPTPDQEKSTPRPRLGAP